MKPACGRSLAFSLRCVILAGICWCVASLGPTCPAGSASGGEPAEKAKASVLIVDGINNHDWQRATGILKTILADSGLFTVDVSTSPPAGAPADQWERWRPDFSKYDAVLSNFNGGHKKSSTHWPGELEKSLEDYVRGGGGLVIFHSANNSFPNWEAYNEMIGLGWRNKDFGPTLIVGDDEKVVRIPKGEGRNPGHGPDHDFQITVLDTSHPITNGLPKKWMHPCEQLSHGQHGPARNMTVLSCAWSKDSKQNEVVDWVVPYGKGRVYTTMLGHLWRNGPDKNLRCVGFLTALIRGTQWAATGKVTYPVPDNFPTPTEMSVRDEPDAPDFKITTRKQDDQVKVATEGDKTVFTVTSRSGIGGAVIGRAGDRWPKTIVVRLRLRGLESLTISHGTAKLSASVLSHSGNKRLLHLWKGGKEGPQLEKDSQHWADIRTFDSMGKPIQGLPAKGGYFEMTLPNALLEGNPKSITLGWIDFYRM